jgi:small ubiquitin-related modifier
MEEGDVKPAVLPGLKSVSVRVHFREQDGVETTIIAHSEHTKMKYCFEKFSDLRGLDPYTTRYMLNGKDVDPNDKVKMLELKSSDRIEVFTEDPGTLPAGRKTAGPEGEIPEIVEHVVWVTVRFREQSGEMISFKVKGTTRMKVVFEKFAEMKGIEVDLLRFMLDGDRLHSGVMAKMLDLEEDGHIEVLPYTHGGRENVDL